MDQQRLEPDRRRFLGWAAAAGSFFAAHACGALEEPMSASPADRDQQGTPRIRSLELLTSAPLATMKAFYQRSLGLRLVEEQTDRLTIEAGATPVTFLQAPAEIAKPFYHFAFNIPENKILTAHRWQKQRTPLLPIPETLQDPAYPADVVNYRHWNAHSIFFFDPAGNVVEYIARHDLKNAAGGDFDSADILYASEIAFVVDDVPGVTSKLKEVVGVEQYRTASDQFAAVGDERGLLLVMKRGRVISFEAPERKAVSVFPTVAAVRGDRQTRYAFAEFPYQIAVGSSPGDAAVRNESGR